MNADDMKARIAELESKLEAASASKVEHGRIWPDVSRTAPKPGKKATGCMVLRGVNANPQNTVNLYASQFARLLPQLPAICTAMLIPDLWGKFSFRTPAEQTLCKATLEAYIAASKDISK